MSLLTHTAVEKKNLAATWDPSRHHADLEMTWVCLAACRYQHQQQHDRDDLDSLSHASHHLSTSHITTSHITR